MKYVLMQLLKHINHKRLQINARGPPSSIITFQSSTVTKVQRKASLREEKLSKQSRQLKCDAIFMGGVFWSVGHVGGGLIVLKKGPSLHLFAHFKINLDPEILPIYIREAAGRAVFSYME